MTRHALQGAADAGVDMVVLPELFLPGYNSTTATPPDAWDAVLPRLAALCREVGIAMTVGLPEYAGDRVYNSAYALSKSGEILARYRKVQLFGPREQTLFCSGEQHVVFEYMGRRFGLLICYDVEFPEHVRALARAGAEVILVPTANMRPFMNVNQFLVPARAAENAVTVVYANYCGTEGDLDYVGLSTICGPDGYTLACKGTEPGLALADLPSGWSEHGLPLGTHRQDFRAAKDPT